MKNATRFVTLALLATLAFTQAPASAAEPTRPAPPPRHTQTFQLSGVPIPADNATSLAGDQFSTEVLAATQCWAGMAELVRYNAVGSLRYHARINVEWCSSGGNVTSNALRRCTNLGGFLEFTGCSTSRGTLNLSSLSIYGDWNYRFGCCGLYTYYGADLAMKVYANGTYSGTWTWT